MAEDESVVGRRRIYCDQHGSEVLICSDSEEELTEPKEDKNEFIDVEDQILWIGTKVSRKRTWGGRTSGLKVPEVMNLLDWHKFGGKPEYCFRFL